MSHPGSPSVVGDVDFPRTSGTVTGWVGLLLLAIGVAVVVRGTSGVGAVRGVVALLLAAVLVHAYLLRPRVRIADDTLVLVNPLSTLRVPLQRVRRVSVRAVTVVTTEDRTYAGVGVGRALRQMVRPSGEGVAPVAGSWGGRFNGLGIGPPPAPRTPRSTETADMLEDSVARAVLQVRDARAGQDPPAVRRQWSLAHVVSAVVLAAVLVVSLAV